MEETFSDEEDVSCERGREVRGSEQWVSHVCFNPCICFKAISAALPKYSLCFIQKQMLNEEPNGELPNFGGEAEGDVQTDIGDAEGGDDVPPDQPQGATGGASQPGSKAVAKGTKPSKARLSKLPQQNVLSASFKKPWDQVSSIASQVSRLIRNWHL